MRTSALVTISLPQTLVRQSASLAKRQHMTRSELLRTALRRYMEEEKTLKAVTIFRNEQKAGKLKVIKGSMTSLWS